jgi:hypothetical protein
MELAWWLSKVVKAFLIFNHENPLNPKIVSYIVSPVFSGDIKDD